MLGEYKNNKARIPEGIQKLKSEKNIYFIWKCRLCEKDV